MMTALSHSAKLVLAMTVSMVVLTACGHKEEKAADNQAAASVAEAAPPMSAAPAKDTNTPVLVNEDTATVDAGPEVANTASTATASDVAVAVPESGEGEGVADNSAMEHISENDQVIDDQPASPNAPRASEESSEPVSNQAVGNAKVGQ